MTTRTLPLLTARIIRIRERTLMIFRCPRCGDDHLMQPPRLNLTIRTLPCNRENVAVEVQQAGGAA